MVILRHEAGSVMAPHIPLLAHRASSASIAAAAVERLPMGGVIAGSMA
jgi:hypothetical protein